MLRFSILLVVISALPLGCIGTGLLTDGSSLSFGNHANGLLRHGTHLAERGQGYVVPKQWRERRRSFGTDELVDLLRYTAEKVEQLYPRSIVGIADLSLPGGGDTPEHLSHTSGRDVDLIYYVLDAQGRPRDPLDMVAFAASGVGLLKSEVSDGRKMPSEGEFRLPQLRRFDVRRNWAFVRTLITNPDASVQWIFVSESLKTLMLEYAKTINEPEMVIAYANALMHQPSDASPHDDHMHIRIYCSEDDRRYGCVDSGPERAEWRRTADDIPVDIIPNTAAIDALKQFILPGYYPHLPAAISL